jgi:hypothetical protein
VLQTYKSYCSKEKGNYSSIQNMNEEDNNALNEILLKKRAVQLHVMDTFSDNFVPKEIPVRLISIYNPDFAKVTKKLLQNVIA